MQCKLKNAFVYDFMDKCLKRAFRLIIIQVLRKTKIIKSNYKLLKLCRMSFLAWLENLGFILKGFRVYFKLKMWVSWLVSALKIPFNLLFVAALTPTLFHGSVTYKQLYVSCVKSFHFSKGLFLLLKKNAWVTCFPYHEPDENCSSL